MARRHPEAHVTIITGAIPAGLFAAFPAKSKTICVLTKASWHRHWLMLWAQVVRTRWDLVLDFRRSLLGYVLWCRTLMRPLQALPRRHKLQAIAQGCGLPVAEAHPRLWWSREDEAHIADRFTLKPAPLVLAPVANWPGKEWPMARFAALAETLTTGAMVGAELILIASADERTRLAAFGEFTSQPFTLCAGDLTLGQIAALLARAGLFVGNDSGLMHMAAAAGCPTLGLFGPSEDVVYGAWRPGHKSVRTPASSEELWRRVRDQGDEGLMDALPLAEVVEAAHELLKEKHHD